MEKSKITYTGMSNRADEYISADGELSAAINLINDTGAYRTLPAPQELLTLDSGERVLFIHKNLDYEHYIIFAETGLYYIDANQLSNPTRKQIISKSYTLSNPPKITSIGNTLIIRTTNSLEYALFKTDHYLPLGSKPPVADITFALSGDFTISDSFSIIDGLVASDTIPPSARDTDFSLENVPYEDSEQEDYINHFISEFTDTTLSEVNKFINERVTEKNRFIYPFFIRYAYRMYDGTYFMHSHPILMIPSTDINPIVFIQTLNCHSDGVSDDKPQTQVNIVASVSALICDIKYKLNRYYDEMTQQTTTDISNWNELITSIDIFITSPSYSYDINGEVYGWKRLNDSDTLDTYALAQISNSTFSNRDKYQQYEYTEQFRTVQGKFNFSKDIDCITTTYNSTRVRHPRYYMQLPRVNHDTRTSNICKDSIFYRIASLKFDELMPQLSKLSITDGVITNLPHQPQLSDDYKSHTQITAKAAYTYNSRLNIGNITEHLYNGMPLSTQFTHCESVETVTDTTIYTYLKKDGAEYIVATPPCSRNLALSPYYYYPDTDAYKQVIIQRNGNTIVNRCEVPLTPHTLLNGAYHFEGFYNVLKATTLQPAPSTDCSIRYQSTIYTSHIMNPFIFHPELINNVGTGAISALSSATKAISEGQFGQFPLHAFTSDGVWALGVNATGGYTNSQPITRDVIKGDKVLQLKQSLIFPTEKGIIQLIGGNSEPITTTLDGRFNSAKLAKLTQILSATDHTELIIPDINFTEFIKNATLTYDHIHQLIYLSNHTYGYSYIYSQISKSWSCASYAFSNSISDYSQNIVTMVDNDGTETIYNINSNNNVANKSLIITRPIKLGLHNQYKSINSVVTQGIFTSNSNRIPVALYGSIDGVNYIPIATSASDRISSIGGSPYKYFIIVQPLELEADESIIGTELTFEPRTR